MLPCYLTCSSGSSAAFQGSRLWSTWAPLVWNGAHVLTARLIKASPDSNALNRPAVGAREENMRYEAKMEFTKMLSCESSDSAREAPRFAPPIND